MRKRVYIAGPISKGDLAHNIRQAEEAFFLLLKAGLAPFCPHWSCYSNGPAQLAPGVVAAVATQNGGGGCGHADWLGADLPWVAVSEAVLRLPGESTGADMEVKEAVGKGIPVFYSVADVLAWAG
jgi:hypothetical protein